MAHQNLAENETTAEDHQPNERTDPPLVETTLGEKGGEESALRKVRFYYTITEEWGEELLKRVWKGSLQVAARQLGLGCGSDLPQFDLSMERYAVGSLIR